MIGQMVACEEKENYNKEKLEGEGEEEAREKRTITVRE